MACEAPGSLCLPSQGKGVSSGSCSQGLGRGCILGQDLEKQEMEWPINFFTHLGSGGHRQGLKKGGEAQASEKGGVFVLSPAGKVGFPRTSVLFFCELC